MKEIFFLAEICITLLRVTYASSGRETFRSRVFHILLGSHIIFHLNTLNYINFEKNFFFQQIHASETLIPMNYFDYILYLFCEDSIKEKNQKNYKNSSESDVAVEIETDFYTIDISNG